MMADQFLCLYTYYKSSYPKVLDSKIIQGKSVIVILLPQYSEGLYCKSQLLYPISQRQLFSAMLSQWSPYNEREGRGDRGSTTTNVVSGSMVCDNLSVWTIYSQNSKICRIISILMLQCLTEKRIQNEDIFWGGENSEINKNTKENSDHL